MTSRTANIFAQNLWQFYQDIGELHGPDAQQLLREALDGFYHEALVTSMLTTVDAGDAIEQDNARRELSDMLDDFVANGSDAEVILHNMIPFCLQDSIKSVSEIIRAYLNQQKSLLTEVHDPEEQQLFRKRLRTLHDRANQYFGHELRAHTEIRLRRGRIGPSMGEA